jgi:tRNA A-37 threonylcarbamoyl transferase component Bud32
MLEALVWVVLFLSGCSNINDQPGSPEFTTQPSQMAESTAVPKILNSSKPQYSFASTIAVPKESANMRERSTSDRARSVQLFLSLITEYAKSYKALSKGEKLYYDPKCPPKLFRVSGVKVALDFTNPLVHADSAEAEVYLDTADRFVVKVSNNKMSGNSQLWRDSAALQVLSSKAVPRVHWPDFPSSTSEACKLRTLVMESVGETDLMKYRDKYGPLDSSFVSNIGLAAINLLEQVHAAGLVHGDVHGGNFVFFKSDPVTSLRIIDFGRARPYIDPKSGEHVKLTWMREEHLNWNPLFLSAYELQGWTVSRRDDLFRLAELLVYLVSNDNHLYDRYRGVDNQVYLTLPGSDELLKRKIQRKFSSIVPLGFIQMYRETLNMDFTETPDYDRFRYLVSQ